MVILSLALPCSAAEEAGEANAVRPGELLVDNPTLHNLSFRWLVEGDENRNATVQVHYRKRGEPSWRPALPMLRIFRERTNEGQAVTGNLFAGSVLNLEPATAYEVRFDLTDPDGGGNDEAAVVEVEPDCHHLWFELLTVRGAGGGELLVTEPAALSD